MQLAFHIYVFVLVVALPVFSYFNFQKLLHHYRADGDVSRLNLYYSTIVLQWVLLCVAFVLLLLYDVELADIGFTWHVDIQVLFGLALGLLTLIGLLMQWRLLRNSSDDRLTNYANSHDQVVMMLPQNPQELRVFYGLSCTAGVVEEILWRGLVVWYFAQFVPLWVALLLSLLAFTGAHAYQGIKQVPGIFLIGLVLTAVYWLTGSLWPCIALHIAIDVVQGRTANEMFKTLAR